MCARDFPPRGDEGLRPRAAGRKTPPSGRKDGRPHHLFSAAQPPRRFCAAPPVRRSTQGAPVWGDRSLSNKRGPRCAVRSGEQKRMGGWEAPLLEGVKNAAFGRIEKFGPRSARNPPSGPRPQTSVPARGGHLSSPRRARNRFPSAGPPLTSGWRKPIPPAASPPPPFTQGRHRGIRLSAEIKKKKAPGGALFLLFPVIFSREPGR